MGRRKSLPENMRACRCCGDMLELNAMNFRPSATSRNGFLIDCRGCIKIRPDSKADSPRRRAPAKNVGANCGECFGLAWQVVGPACIGCGLAHAEEPRPAFVLWRSWAHAYV